MSKGNKRILPTYALQVLLNASMKMHRPIVQGNVNAVSLRIVLLDVIEETSYLLEIEAASSPYQRLTACYIQHARATIPSRSAFIVLI